MSFMEFDAVLFDLDGTLAETGPEICDAINDTLSHFSLPTVSEAMVGSWLGNGANVLLIRALAFSKKIPEDEIRKSDELSAIRNLFFEKYLERSGTRSSLYPHVTEALASLQARGVKLAVVTNKNGSFAERVLQAHGIRSFFDCIVSGDTLPTRKPDPAGVSYCLKKLGISPERTLFVGDSSVDAETARNAALKIWLVPYGYNRGGTVQDCQADRVIDDFSVFLR